MGWGCKQHTKEVAMTYHKPDWLCCQHKNDIKTQIHLSLLGKLYTNSQAPWFSYCCRQYNYYTQHSLHTPNTLTNLNNWLLACTERIPYVCSHTLCVSVIPAHGILLVYIYSISTLTTINTFPACSQNVFAEISTVMNEYYVRGEIHNFGMII